MGESINSGIGGVPEEILEQVLRCVSTNNLLHSARLVSRRWKRISTSLCRQRFVELAHLKRGEQTVFDVFPDSVDIPWSSITCLTDEDEPVPDFVYQRPVLELFGNQFWKLTVLELDIAGALLHILRFTPNLRSLKVLRNQVFATEQVSKVSLPFLKTLKMWITNDSVNLFEFLVLTCSVHLDKVKLRILLGISVETVVKCSSLLATIPVIFLKVYHSRHVGPEALTAIASAKLQLRKLNLTFVEPSQRRALGYFSPIEAILRNSANTLRSLKFFCKYGEGHSKTPLKFPILPVLKVLKVRFDSIGFHESNNFVRLFLSTVTSEHFPVLERVKVHMEFDEFSKFTACLFYRRKKKDQCQFYSVKQLEVNTCHLKDDWSKLFPGLLRLKARVENSDLLAIVFARMLTLTHLDLSFVPEVDLNLELSGFYTRGDLCSALNQEVEQEGQCECRRHVPCILSLTALKTLELTCEDDITQLEDSGADLALLPLQPLDKLVLRNQNISEDCKARLVARHHNVEII